MTSGGNNFNDFPGKCLVSLPAPFKIVGLSIFVRGEAAYICCTISISFLSMAEKGHLASREGLGRDAEQ